MDQQSPRFYISAEIYKALLKCFCCTIYIQMIRVHCTDHCDIREKLQKTSVIFICLHNTNRFPIFCSRVAPEIGSIVTGYTPEESCSTKTTMSEDMPCHCSGSGL